VLYIIYSFPSYISYSWTIEQIDRHRSSAEDYTNMSYYNLCGIGSQQNNISKGKGGKKGGGVHIKNNWYARPQ
jgi:hypothetical protein